MSHNGYLTYSLTRAAIIMLKILYTRDQISYTSYSLISFRAFAFSFPNFLLLARSRGLVRCEVSLCTSRMCIGVFSSHITKNQSVLYTNPTACITNCCHYCLFSAFLLILFDVPALDQPPAADPSANLI